MASWFELLFGNIIMLKPKLHMAMPKMTVLSEFTDMHTIVPIHSRQRFFNSNLNFSKGYSKLPTFQLECCCLHQGVC